MRFRTLIRSALASAAVLMAIVPAAPAAADCVAATVTYTSPSGSQTTTGGCIASTPFPTFVSHTERDGTTVTGYVTVTAQVPAP